MSASDDRRGDSVECKDGKIRRDGLVLSFVGLGSLGVVTSGDGKGPVVARPMFGSQVWIWPEPSGSGHYQIARLVGRTPYCLSGSRK